MRIVPLVIVLSVAGTQARAQAITPVRDVAPAGTIVNQAAATADGQRIYVLGASGDIWLYDRAARTSTQIARVNEEAWYWNVAPGGHALAYTKNDEDNKAEHVWAIPLDVRTGKPTGPERRVALSGGDAPSISPDGRWMAFARDDSVGQTLMLVPLAGGPERVIAALHAGIGLIRWTPDSKSLLFSSDGSIRRVSSDGGAVTLVASGGSEPGLSPDGKLLVYRDTSAFSRYIVAEASGKRLSTFDLPETQEIHAWADGGNLLVSTATVFRRLRSFSIATGQSRVVIDSMTRLMQPVVSPDGKRVALARTAFPKAELIVANLDGSGLRRFLLAKQFALGNVWSPDGRWTAYHVGARGGFSDLRVVDVTTGRETTLSSTIPGVRTFGVTAWSADSKRALFVEHGDSTGGPTPMRQFLVRESALNGPPTLLRTLTLAREGGFVWTIGDGTMLVRRAFGEATILTTIKEGGPETVLLPALPGLVSIPSFSADGQWIAFRRNPAQTNNSHLTVLEVVQRDGTHRTTITLPFPAAPGFDSPHFLPGNQQLILAEDASQPAGGAVYLVTLSDKSVKKLFTLPRERNRNLQQYAVTPDGKTILYLTTDDAPPSFGLMAVPGAKR